MSLRQSRDELIKRGVLKEIFEKGELNAKQPDLFIYCFISPYSLIFLFEIFDMGHQKISSLPVEVLSKLGSFYKKKSVSESC